MNFLKRFGGSSDEDFIYNSVAIKSIIEKSVDLFIRFSIDIKDHGVGPLHRELILNELLKEYRGSSELEPLYWIALILTNGSWIKKKNETGYGFRGSFKVKVTTENFSIDRSYNYDRTFFMSVKSWTLMVNLEFTSRPTQGGFDPGNRIKKFMDEHNIQHPGINFSDKMILS
ncbi:matrix [Sandjimba virus]|uniref:Matrix n=1 Tax=Sandjimba virus TaxID=380432 RepID=A0AAE8XEM5_9RHAB|nr:matrix [Sandjimba virus]UAU42854.1 matrix [Sandjimba virus]